MNTGDFSLSRAGSGCERTLQGNGSSYNRSHAHVCYLFLWIRTGQEAPAEISWWCPYVGDWFVTSDHVVLLSQTLQGWKFVFASASPGLPQVSAAVCCRDVVRHLHHSHHGSRRAHQMSPTGQRLLNVFVCAHKMSWQIYLIVHKSHLWLSFNFSGFRLD